MVEADLPLLIGNTSLKKAEAELKYGINEVILYGNRCEMIEKTSGHFGISIRPPVGKADLCLIIRDGELTEKELWKLHHYFGGHGKTEKLEKLIKDSGRMTSNVKKRMIKLEKEYEGCRVYNNRIPSPAVSLPKAKKHNECVTLDLKEWEAGQYKYILYLVDVFSRFTIGVFIPNKEAVTVAEMILAKWISVFGIMNQCHNDRGSEFLNSEMFKLLDYLGVKHTATASYSPNMNGLNERNHAIVDRMMNKMLMMEATLKPEIALLWSINAKNSLENHQGFSPSQLMFGENPRLPALYSTGPQGMEEVNVSKKLAEHLSAIQLAREAFVECESDRILKTAL